MRSEASAPFSTRLAALTVALGALAACSEAAPSKVLVLVPPQPVSISAPSSSTAPLELAEPAPIPAAVAGPAPPPVRPVDPALDVDGIPLLLGANARELWLTFIGYTVVVDRKTRCATESYRDADVLRPLRLDEATEADLARPEVLAALREIVGFGRRFGAQAQRFVRDLVWSPDGHHVFLVLMHTLYRSDDGGASFARVDDHPSSHLAMSRDGTRLAYERCVDPRCAKGTEFVSLALDAPRRSPGSHGSAGSQPPAVPSSFLAGQALFLRMGAGTRALFTRSDAEICVDTFDLGGPRRVAESCLPMPKNTVGPWPSRRWISVSPSGNYGIVRWNELRPNLARVTALTDVLALVDMKAGRILRTVTDLRGEVDDRGNMVLESSVGGAGDHTYFYPLTGGRRLLGDHSLLAWSEGVAILAVYSRGKLGAKKCDLVKLVDTP